MTADVVISETTIWTDATWQRREIPMATDGSKKEPTEPIIYRFEPERDNEFLSGVPPRDLTQADVDALEPDARFALEASSIYVEVATEKKTEKKTEDDE